MSNCTDLNSTNNCTKTIIHFGDAMKGTVETNLLATVQCILGVIICVLNLLVVLSIVRHKKLRTVSNIFRGYLAVNDTVLGLITFIRGFLEVSGTLNKAIPCVTINLLLLASGGITASGVFLLWIEGYLSTRQGVVKGPFNKKIAHRLIILTTALWVTYVNSFLLFLRDKRSIESCHLGNGLIHEYHLLGLVFVVFLHFIVLITLQGLTFRNLSKHVKYLKERGVMSTSTHKSTHRSIRHIKVAPINNDNALIHANIPRELNVKPINCDDILTRPLPRFSHKPECKIADIHTSPTPGCSYGPECKIADIHTSPTPGCSYEPECKIADIHTSPTPGCSYEPERKITDIRTNSMPERPYEPECKITDIRTSPIAGSSYEPECKIADIHTSPTPGCSFGPKCKITGLHTSPLGRTCTKSHHNEMKFDKATRQNMIYYRWSLRMTRLVKLISFILFSFILCYTPYVVCLSLYSINPENVSGQSIFITASIVMFNSFTNPIIYIFRSKEYRDARSDF